ncbi:TylF/MycF/NovP-related O-methyltransferase [Thiohalomonas denitrificans]|uniref:TylF/MycF/NovP-related O-methyltransferase n=1 Tax=Thiohalomonas denitrificans TaxID=415747 RepID=UPI0026F1B34F|nr:TylF/MycF/NovP-related O-methyltransferase [Thiohalomonas denitrificans]
MPFGRRVFTPWFNDQGDDEFATLLKSTRQSGALMASPDRTYVLHQLIRRASRLVGDVAECGVYQGGSAHVIASTLARNASPARLDLFDTFEGVPSIAVAARDYHAPGSFSNTSLERVKERLSEHLPRCRFYAGLIPNTFAQVREDAQYSLANIDVDLYPTNRACCEWFWPRMVPGGVMLFNDYGFYPYRHSTRRAVDEFFAEIDEQPLVLPTGQALVIKTTAANVAIPPLAAQGDSIIAADSLFESADSL